jgi:hypothetical protein
VLGQNRFRISYSRKNAPKFGNTNPLWTCQCVLIRCSDKTGSGSVAAEKNAPKLMKTQKRGFWKDVGSRSQLLMWGPAIDKGGVSFLLVKCRQ